MKRILILIMLFVFTSFSDSGQIMFTNNGNTSEVVSIWYSDFNNQWEEIAREHLASGNSFIFEYDVGSLSYYGWSINSGNTINAITTDDVYLH